MNDPRKRRAGFTLLELLMVVIIIAILASIALPQYLRVAERTRGAEALTVLGAIRSAELRYKAQDPGNLYSTDLTLVDIDVPGIGTTPASALWTYSVTGTGPGNYARATRLAGAQIGVIIDVNLDSGASCSSAGAVYGLPDGLGC